MDTRKDRNEKGNKGLELKLRREMRERRKSERLGSGGKGRGGGEK